MEFELVRGERALIDLDAAAEVICDAGRVRSAYLAFLGKHL